MTTLLTDIIPVLEVLYLSSNELVIEEISVRKTGFFIHIFISTVGKKRTDFFNQLDSLPFVFLFLLSPTSFMLFFLNDKLGLFVKDVIRSKPTRRIV